MPKKNLVPRLSFLASKHKNFLPEFVNPPLVKKPEEIRQFAELFQYIQKNKDIPNFLNNISVEDKKCEQLLNAISRGNLLDDIFSDPNCYLYLLYLLKNQQIPYWHGITVYVYLIVLMQFTNKQELHPNDSDVKDIRLVTLEKITRDGELSKEGALYLKKSIANFEEVNFDVQYDELVHYIFMLPIVEQWLIKIPKYNAPNDCDLELDIISANLPFFLCYNDFYYIPSSSVISFFLHKINLFPLELYPVFGDLKFESVLQRHRKNEHPVSLYAPLVKSNPSQLNDRRCGPFPMWIHDIGHVFWGSMFTIAERNFVMHRFIPCLQQLREEASLQEDNQLVQFIEELINLTQDLDLSNIRQFKNSDTRLIDYLSRIFYRQFKNSPDAKLGSCVEDRLFFLLLRMYFSTPAFFERDKIIWNTFFSKFFTQSDSSIFTRQFNIIKALLQLAKSIDNIDLQWEAWFEESLNDIPVYPINWYKLQEILNTVAKPCELWNKIDNETLISLILHHDFHCFPFYIHPSQNDWENLKQLTQTQINYSKSLRLFPIVSTVNKENILLLLKDTIGTDFYFSTTAYAKHLIYFDKSKAFEQLISYLDRFEQANITCKITGDAYIKWKFKREGKCDHFINGFFTTFNSRLMPRLPEKNKIELLEPLVSIQEKLAIFLDQQSRELRELRGSEN
ncbi:MAG: hypothetical protein Q8M03_09155 [Legionella sp.]|nr:hypothetical protein [Legionella sp.]